MISIATNSQWVGYEKGFYETDYPSWVLFGFTRESWQRFFVFYCIVNTKTIFWYVFCYLLLIFVQDGDNADGR